MHEPRTVNFRTQDFVKAFDALLREYAVIQYAGAMEDAPESLARVLQLTYEASYVVWCRDVSLQHCNRRTSLTQRIKLGLFVRGWCASRDQANMLRALLNQPIRQTQAQIT